MIPLNYIFKKFTRGYKFTKSLEKINQLLSMDNIKYLAKNEKYSDMKDTLIKTTRIYSQYLGMEFGTENVSYS